MIGTLVIICIGVVLFLVWAIRKGYARQRAIQAREAIARAEYERQRTDFLANASPLEAQAFLIREQTDALIRAQRQNAAFLGFMVLLNGTQSPFGDHGHGGR